MQKLIELRKAKGWSQARLAEALGCTAACISNYEKGLRSIDLNTAARIAAALGCTVDDLIDKETA